MSLVLGLPTPDPSPSLVCLWVHYLTNVWLSMTRTCLVEVGLMKQPWDFESCLAKCIALSHLLLIEVNPPLQFWDNKNNQVYIIYRYSTKEGSRLGSCNPQLKLQCFQMKQQIVSFKTEYHYCIHIAYRYAIYITAAVCKSRIDILSTLQRWLFLTHLN